MDKKPSYAGVGSRKTPLDTCRLMTRIAKFLEGKGYVLRSGGAIGADSAFEAGVTDPENKEIFLPWKSFSMNYSKLYMITEEALKMAERFHPAWEMCDSGVKKLHARNCYEILGKNLDDPCKFLVCWTPNGKSVGGTSQAIRLAVYNHIPIINLAIKKQLDFVDECLRTDQIFFIDRDKNLAN